VVFAVLTSLSLWCTYGTTATQLAEKFANQAVAQSDLSTRRATLDRLRGRRDALKFTETSEDAARTAEATVATAADQAAAEREWGGCKDLCRQREAEERDARAAPCERGGRLYRASRADKVWSQDDEASFLGKASEHLHLPFLLALWTGQRQGDLLRLPWSSYDGTHIRLRQSKTGIRVVIPVGSPLKTALDAASKLKKSPLILTNSEGKPWTADCFRSSWRKACAAAGIVGLTFHDLRGTAVTRLAAADCTEAEIATLTGHALRDVRSILDANYLHRDPALAERAIRKLEKSETRTKTPD
jgi:integrase